MNEDIFVYDTYALIEIMNKNPGYEKYTLLKPIINDFIFAEFCYNLFKDNVKNSENHINEIKPAIVHVDTETIKEAMQFRLEWKKRKVSMTDCIGYYMAKKLDIKFLTGDKEFEGLDGVEFVK